MQGVIARIIDKLITRKQYTVFEKIIPDQQHGFVSGRETTSNLLETASFINKHIGKSGKVDTVYFDIFKAFDRLNHRILMAKLGHAF